MRSLWLLSTFMWFSPGPGDYIEGPPAKYRIFLLARTKYRMKVLLFILLTLVLIGIATCIGIASAGLQTLEEGQLMSHCASSYLSFAKKPLSNFHFIYFGPFFEACVFSVVFVRELCFVAQGTFLSSPKPRFELVTPTIIQRLHDSSFPILNILKTCWNTLIFLFFVGVNATV